jgi:hypothetical protein
LSAPGGLKEEERYVIIVNFSDGTAQGRGRVHVPLDELRGKTWRLTDALSGEVYDRSGNEMRDSGLYVDLKPWKCHFSQVHAL